MMLSTSFTSAALFALLGTSLAGHAQRVEAPTLEEVLQRLQANLQHYDKRIPSLFCDEHVISRVTPDTRNRDTVTDSVFRLQRTTDSDHTASLVESREVKNVDGKPATSQEIDGPALLSGAFEGGLGVVSTNQTACMRYDLRRGHAKDANEPYLVQFATELTPQNTADCLLQEDSEGHALIDPASMQIKHLEIITPRHTIVPGTWYAAPVVGKRTLTVDYEPVVLGEEAFWLPSTITMRSVSGSGSFHMTTWSFQAVYRNYHKLQVTSRVHTKPD